LSLGDSHKGFRVLGTNQSYFEHYRYGNKQALALSQGKPFEGFSDVGFSRHDNLPFKVVGIFAPTGTPVDKTVHVSLEAIEAIHVGWESGARLGATPTKIQTFALQRQINTYPQEPLSAILPGVALHELWGMMSVAERALMVVSGFVVVAGLLGMLSSLLTSLQERRREMAILRAMGARPRHTSYELGLIAAVQFAGTVIGIFPALRAYRQSLSDGMTIRV